MRKEIEQFYAADFYSDLKKKITEFAKIVGKGGYERFNSGLLSESDAKELRTGIFYLLSGLDELIKDADDIVAFSPEIAPSIHKLAGHARAIAGGALLVARHLDVTESAKILSSNIQTAPANLGKRKKASERAERVRDIIECAERRPDDRSKLLQPGLILDLVRKRLGMTNLDRKTLMAQVAYIDETGRNDIPPDVAQEK